MTESVGGVGLFFVLIQFSIIAGIVVFAVKLVTRLREISESQKSIAESHAQMVQILATTMQKSDDQANG